MNAMMLQDVRVSYHHKPVLDGVSLAIAAGETVALMGPNGSGKTTLLRAILAQVPFSGRITLGGCDVKKEPAASRRVLGYVPQHPAFPGSLTGAEVVAFWQRLRGEQPAAQPLLEEYGLAHAARQQVRTYSGGMLRRLALALATVGNPKVLLLDEPEAALDREGQQLLLARFARWRASGITVLFTVHNARDLPLVDRAVLLERGSVTFDGPVAHTDRLLALEWQGEQHVLQRLRDRWRSRQLPGHLDTRAPCTLIAHVREQELARTLSRLGPVDGGVRLRVREPDLRECLVVPKPSIPAVEAEVA